MSEVAEYRYVKRRFKDESQYNLHVKEMIEMIKNEQVKENLYVKGIKLSNHAFERMNQHFGVENLATATRIVKEMLSKATRIGSVLAYDGRINVLYAYQQTAFFLSPDLKTVVTVNKYDEVSYKPILNKVQGNIDKKLLIDLHLKHLEEVEAQEQEQIKKMLAIEAKVREANESYVTLLHIVRGGKGRKKNIKSLISEQNLQLKQEGWKLFNIKVKKRHIAKSLVALY